MNYALRARIIRGHTCEALSEFQRKADKSACVPAFTSKGIVEGCDDENPLPILFCPMCGVLLPEPAPAIREH